MTERRSVTEEWFCSGKQKTSAGLKHFTLAKPHPLFYRSPTIVGSSTSFVKHHRETHIIKNCDDTKQRVKARTEARTQENQDQDSDGPDLGHWQSGTDHLKQTAEEAVI